MRGHRQHYLARAATDSVGTLRDTCCVCPRSWPGPVLVPEARFVGGLQRNRALRNSSRLVRGVVSRSMWKIRTRSPVVEIGEAKHPELTTSIVSRTRRITCGAKRRHVHPDVRLPCAGMASYFTRIHVTKILVVFPGKLREGTHGVLTTNRSPSSL